MPSLEGPYKTRLAKKIKRRLLGCLVIRLDPQDIQGIPDLLILFRDRWASLEAKTRSTAPHEPNQDYWVDYMNNMSFSAFIYPENEEEVLDGLYQALES